MLNRWWNTEQLIAETMLHVGARVCVCVYAMRWFAELKGPWESRERGARGVQGEGGVWAERKFGSVQGK